MGEKDAFVETDSEPGMTNLESLIISHFTNNICKNKIWNVLECGSIHPSTYILCNTKMSIMMNEGYDSQLTLSKKYSCLWVPVLIELDHPGTSATVVRTIREIINI